MKSRIILHMGLFTIPRVLVLLAWAGVFVAGTLVAFNYGGGALICARNRECLHLIHRPELVWWGFPIAIYGVGAYLCLALLAGVRIWVPQSARSTIPLSLIISGVGMIISFWLMYQLLFVWKLSCLWCIASASIFTISFILNSVLMQSGHSQLGSRLIEEGVYFFCFILAIGGVAVQYVGFRREAVRLEMQAMVTKIPLINEIVTDSAYMVGDHKHEPVVAMIGDFYCDPCRRAYKTVQKLRKTQPGSFRFYFCQLPLSEGRHRELSHLASEIGVMAARSGKFWAYADKMMLAKPQELQNQQQVINLAFSLGIPIDLRDTTVRAAIRQNQKMSDKLGVSATPLFLIYSEGKKPQIATAASIEAVLRKR